MLVEGLDLPEFLKIKKIAENPSVPNGGKETGPTPPKEHEPAPGWKRLHLTNRDSSATYRTP